MRATMTAAATATIATVETAKSIIPLSSRRLLVRPYNALRTPSPALRSHAPAHPGAPAASRMCSTCLRVRSRPCL
jgi:hypothetical protein